MTGRRLVSVSPVAHPGGAEVGLLRLLGELRGRGWETEVLAAAPGLLLDSAHAAGHRTGVLALGGLRSAAGARAIASWPAARRALGSADVAYLNGTVAGRLLPALRGTRARSVLHVHDVVERVPRMWRSADLVLADSEAVARSLGDLRSAVVFCPIDPSPPAVEPPWDRAAPGPVIGFVGRLEPRKAPLDLVRAAPAIRAAQPSARVVLVGGDPLDADPDYAQAVRTEADRAGVEEHGWAADAAGLMGHLDVLVLPSRQEPFGTVLAEALAAGTPVVATRVGGIPEVVRDGVTGRLVEPGDPDALAAAVLDVLGRRDALGAAGPESVRRFATPAYADRVEALIAP